MSNCYKIGKCYWGWGGGGRCFPSIPCIELYQNVPSKCSWTFFLNSIKVCLVLTIHNHFSDCGFNRNKNHVFYIKPFKLYYMQIMKFDSIGLIVINLISESIICIRRVGFRNIHNHVTLRAEFRKSIFFLHSDVKGWTDCWLLAGHLRR